LIYRGPLAAREIACGLARLLARDGLRLRDAVGTDAAALARG
jgi:dihydroorotate dehydrogenase